LKIRASRRSKKGIRMFASRLTVVAALAVVTSAATAQAHFLWIAPDSSAKEKRVHVYFSETPEPDDPALLSRLRGLKVEQISASGKSQELQVKPADDSLVATPVGKDSPQAYGLNYTYGIHSRNGETYLLVYHARMYPDGGNDHWNVPASDQRLPLEVVPSLAHGKLTVRTLWHGQPVAGAEVKAVAAGGTESEGKSNAAGEFAVAANEAGRYAFRAKYVEQINGEREGKKFQSARHYSTLVVTVAGERAVKVTARKPAKGSKRMAMNGKHLTKTAAKHTAAKPAGGLPDLPFGITSFGAAIVGQQLYVGGGHRGPAHEYDREGHSDQLLRLDLHAPQRWEVVGTVPRLAGLSMVVFGGKIYRIGGFEARNKKGEPGDLHSVADFSAYDPATGHWQNLAALPQGRSSHDAVVVGSRIYVIGGWELRGSSPSLWYDTALQIDLASPHPEWTELPKPPFRRRALAVGEANGKLYALGGMEEEGSATTTTYVFDLAKQTWSPGPKLPGEGLEGFGSCAVTSQGRLFTTTYSGKVWRLSDDGREWRAAGELVRPRFFHRLEFANDTSLLVLGGGNMQEGKDASVEIVPASVSP
jgi:N-acetylneuraminic acid mutarotase